MSEKSLAKVKLRALEDTAMAGRGTDSHIHKSTGMKPHKSPQARWLRKHWVHMSNLGWNGLGEQLGLDLGTQQEPSHVWLSGGCNLFVVTGKIIA